MEDEHDVKFLVNGKVPKLNDEYLRALLEDYRKKNFICVGSKEDLKTLQSFFKSEEEKKPRIALLGLNSVPVYIDEHLASGKAFVQLDGQVAVYSIPTKDNKDE